MTKKKTTKQKTVYLDTKLFERLEKKAFEECRTLSNLIIKILSEYERNLNEN